MTRLLLSFALLGGIAAPVAAQPAETIEYYGQDVIGSVRTDPGPASLEAVGSETMA